MSSSNTTSYTYDLKRNLNQVMYPDNKTITYSYDLNNRLTQKTYSDNSITTFQYDNAGNMIYAGNQNIAYNFTYDSNNRITNITDSNNRTITYTYDAAGNRATMVTPDSQTLTYSYDNNNLPSQITTTLGNFTFTYDAANKRITRALPNGTATAYTYDNSSRLTEIITARGGITIDSTSYTLDGVGNRLTKTNEETPNNSETTTYTYDDENRLTGVQITQNSQTRELIFAYDPMGRRISKTIVRDGIGNLCTAPNTCPQTTTYVYDNQNIILEYASSEVVTRYTHGPNIDEPLAIEKNGQTYYYHADGLGSITALSDTNGNIIQRYEYDSFGNQTITTNGNIQQPYTFTAREYDNETGMYFYRARYYDPKAGRFVTKDPIGFDGGINQYAYVFNNPGKWVDPWGLYWFRQPWQTDFVVGRDENPLVWPGSPISRFIEDYVPAGRTFGEMHDIFVETATSAGFPDWLANIPSMSFMYQTALMTEVLRTLGILSQPKPKEKSNPCK